MAQGYWDQVLAMLKPGDIVIMQFGHNDNGPAAPLKGVGDETEERNREKPSTLWAGTCANTSRTRERKAPLPSSAR